MGRAWGCRSEGQGDWLLHAQQELEEWGRHALMHLQVLRERLGNSYPGNDTGDEHGRLGWAAKQEGKSGLSRGGHRRWCSPGQATSLRQKPAMVWVAMQRCQGAPSSPILMQWFRRHLGCLCLGLALGLTPNSSFPPCLRGSSHWDAGLHCPQPWPGLPWPLWAPEGSTRECEISLSIT